MEPYVDHAIKRNHIMLYAVLASMGAFGSMTKDWITKNPQKNPLAGVDIDAEYELIQQKKSRLPAAKRSMIEFIVKNRPEIDEKVKAAEAEEIKKAAESDNIKANFAKMKADALALDTEKSDDV